MINVNHNTAVVAAEEGKRGGAGKGEKGQGATFTVSAIYPLLQ